MNIAIFDPSGSHGHYAYTQSQIFEDDIIEWFIHKTVYLRLSELGAFDKNNHNIHIYDPQTSLVKYYLKSIWLINKKQWDVLFFNTLQSDWLSSLFFFLLIKKSLKIVLTVHNINSFFSSSPKPGLTDFIKKQTRRLAKRKCSFNVFGENLKEQLHKFQPESEVFLIPYQVFTPSKLSFEKHTDKKLKIVIPGSVDLKRRNYSVVLEIIKSLSQIRDIQFVLLGKPAGPGSEEIISEFNKFHDTVISYHNFVSESEFENQMLSADLIWGPLYKFYDTGEEIEEYGITKETGITFAIIKYALPSIFPGDLSIMDEIKSGVKCYNNNEELIQIILGFYTDRDSLIEMKINALFNSQRFKPEEIRQSFIKQLFYKSIE